MEFFEMPVIGSALVEKVVNYSGRAFTSTGTDAYMLALTDSGIVFPRKPTRNRIRRHTKCRTLSPSRGGLRLCVIRRQPRRQALQLTLECTYLTPPLNAAETTGGIEMQLLPKASDDCMLSRTFCWGSLRKRLYKYYALGIGRHTHALSTEGGKTHTTKILLSAIVPGTMFLMVFSLYLETLRLWASS